MAVLSGLDCSLCYCQIQMTAGLWERTDQCDTHRLQPGLGPEPSPDLTHHLWPLTQASNWSVNYVNMIVEEQELTWAGSALESGLLSQTMRQWGCNGTKEQFMEVLFVLLYFCDPRLVCFTLTSQAVNQSQKSTFIIRVCQVEPLTAAQILKDSFGFNGSLDCCCTLLGKSERSIHVLMLRCL